MDDTRIRQLTEEVLSQVRGAVPTADLEARVATLEAAVARLLSAHGAAAPGVVDVVASPATPAPARDHAASPGHSHASLQLLRVSGGSGGPCILEPDKPCVGLGLCQALGH